MFFMRVLYCVFVLLLFACVPSGRDAETQLRCLESSFEKQYLPALGGQNYARVYPLYYAGACIKEGKLVVRVPMGRLTDEERADLQRRMGGGTFEVEACDYPREVAEGILEELKEIQESGAYDKDSLSWDMTFLFGRNQICVSLALCDERQVAFFRRTVMDSPLLVFRDSGRICVAD